MPDTSDTSATQATRMQHECNTSDTSETWATRMRQKCNTSATWVRHEWKNFDFDSYTSKNIFLHPYIYYMVNERLQGEKRFHYMNYLLELLRSHVKMFLKSAPQKLNFLMTKAISKSCTLDCSCKCPCTFPHSYAQ